MHRYQGSCPLCLRPHVKRPDGSCPVCLTNGYSGRFAEYLFARHPSWRQYSRVEDFWKAACPGSVTITLVAPVANEQRLLVISTDRNEVTVFFTYTHDHFGRDPEQSELASFDEALTIIEDILAERTVVMAHFDSDDQCLSSGFASPEPDDGEYWGTGVFRTWSWLGTYDGESLIAPPGNPALVAVAEAGLGTAITRILARCRMLCITAFRSAGS